MLMNKLLFAASACAFLALLPAFLGPTPMDADRLQAIAGQGPLASVEDPQPGDEDNLANWYCSGEGWDCTTCWTQSSLGGNYTVCTKAGVHMIHCNEKEGETCPGVWKDCGTHLICGPDATCDACTVDGRCVRYHCYFDPT